MPRTGVHTVADVFCLGCNDRVGWFYHKASDHTQKYKEGGCLGYSSLIGDKILHKGNICSNERSW
jgi:hypothetical protein